MGDKNVKSTDAVPGNGVKRKISAVDTGDADSKQKPHSKRAKKKLQSEVSSGLSAIAKTINGSEGETTARPDRKSSAEEASTIKKRQKAFQKMRMQQPKLFLLPCERTKNGNSSSAAEGMKQSKIHLTKRREPISLTEVMYLLQYGLLGNSASFQPSWCKLLRVAKVAKVVLIILNGVTSRVYRRKRHCFPNIASKSLSVKLIPAYSYFAMLQDILSCHKSISKMKLQDIRRVMAEKKKRKAAVSLPVNGELEGGGANGESEGGDPPPGRTQYLLGSDEMEKRGFPKPDSESFVHTNHVDHVTDNSPIFGIDCEMVITSAGSELARVTLVDEEGSVKYNSYSKPHNPVRDYVTRYSGITKTILDPVETRLKDVQQNLLQLLPPDAILVGQGLENDLMALKIYHPHCVDTSDMFTASNRKVKLKYLVKEYLGRDIQCSTSGHDSVEDALAAIDLFKLKLSMGDKLRNFYREVSTGPVFQQRESIFETAKEQQKKTSALDNSFTLKKFKKEPVNCIVCSNDKEMVRKAHSAIAKSDFVHLQLHGYNNLIQGSTVRDEDIESTLSLMDDRVGAIVESLPPNTLHVVVMPGYVERRDKAGSTRGDYRTRNGRCVVGLKLDKIVLSKSR
ncbi:uncharacterized protein [Diadema antillarum]|uniref:uncharacterized protein n=1 Tax=Diadema antillarum TaxID=105358 RepID=UPI003A89C355